jgi:hypothetical protein
MSPLVARLFGKTFQPAPALDGEDFRSGMWRKGEEGIFHVWGGFMALKASVAFPSWTMFEQIDFVGDSLTRQATNVAGLCLGALSWAVFDQAIIFWTFIIVAGLNLLKYLISCVLSLRPIIEWKFSMTLAMTYTYCLPAIGLLMVALPAIKHALFSFAGFTLIDNLDYDAGFDLKLLLAIAGLVFPLVRLFISILQILLSCASCMSLRSILEKFILVVTVSINLMNFVFIFIGIPVLVMSIEDVDFGAFMLFLTVTLQYIGEFEAGFKKCNDSPAHPDTVISESFTENLLTSLDHNASEFWQSMRPFFLAFILRGPKIAPPSFASPVEKYYWGISSEHFEKKDGEDSMQDNYGTPSYTWLESSETWRRSGPYSRNELEEKQEISQRVHHYMKNVVERETFSDAAVCEFTEPGTFFSTHFMWEMYERISSERATVEKVTDLPELEEAECGAIFDCDELRWLEEAEVARWNTNDGTATIGPVASIIGPAVKMERAEKLRKASSERTDSFDDDDMKEFSI